MRGARFSASGMDELNELRFATAVSPDLTPHATLVAQWPLTNIVRRVQYDSTALIHPVARLARPLLGSGDPVWFESRHW